MVRPFVFIIIALLIFLALFCIYFPTVSRYQEYRLEQEEMAQELKKLQKQIKVLEKERSQLKEDKDYIEKIIREELGLVKPGEVVYKLVEEKKLPAIEVKNPSETSPENQKAAA